MIKVSVTHMLVESNGIVSGKLGTKTQPRVSTRRMRDSLVDKNGIVGSALGQTSGIGRDLELMLYQFVCLGVSY